MTYYLVPAAPAGIEQPGEYEVRHSGSLWAMQVMEPEPQAVHAYVEELNREEAAAYAALASNEDLALCGIGWHRQVWETDLVFLRFEGQGGGWRFLAGLRPFRWACPPLTFFSEDCERWVCDACGDRLVPA